MIENSALFFFPITLFISFLINWLFLRFSKNLGTRNNETLNQERWKNEVKPSLGGFSFFIIFLISFAIIGFIPFEQHIVYNQQIIGTLAASTLGFIIGLADDAYNTNPLLKFIGQLTCAFILIVMGVVINVTGNTAIDYGITTLWVIGLMNSINMLDNMDGITTSTSISIIVCAILFILSDGIIRPAFLFVCIGVLGALLGFLFFNWNPAKMYMGDTGSQFLGVFLAAVSIIFFWKEKDAYGGIFQIKQFIVPMLVFIVPLTDTITVSVRRLMRKQSPFIGGRDHTTHHLVFFGFSEKQTALFLLSISLISIPIALALHTGYIQWTNTISVCCYIYFFLVFSIIQIIYDKGKAKQKVVEKNE